ncbi:beta-galactoside alpha- -sialyltransferase 2 [Limosa lapponica baueri]|uniref:Beta-galactoside alpha--sialyltransferase 2 n=1 Tax=Limosa lapponica baueri TaxID=1758121 RepID=A0A2I0U3W6_LIMLA|nr:beta-galactoside alpha- -sialyltransferase 2 [Limosa lapponica baueri]
MGTSDTARSSLKTIKKDYRVLKVAIRDSGMLVVFSSVFLVKGKGLDRVNEIWQINKWPQNCCHSQVFGFLDHGTLRNLVYRGLIGSTC